MSGRSEEEREEGKEVGREGNGGGGWGEVVASNPLYDGGVISLLCGKKTDIKYNCKSFFYLNFH